MLWKPEMRRAEARLLEKAMNRDTAGINSIYYHSDQNGPNPVTCQWAPRLAWSCSKTLMSPKTCFFRWLLVRTGPAVAWSHDSTPAGLGLM